MWILRFLLPLAAVAFFVWLVRQTTQGGELCQLRVRGGDVEMRGVLPLRSRADLLDFFRGLDLPDGAVVTVRGSIGRLRVECGAHVPKQLHQRIRNFLLL